MVDFPKGETVDSINEFTVVGEFGFLRLVGPFAYEKEGTVWTAIISDDESLNPFTRDSLFDLESECAVAVADGEVIAGGIIIDILEDGDRLVVAVDQYPQGNIDDEENP